MSLEDDIDEAVRELTAARVAYRNAERRYLKLREQRDKEPAPLSYPEWSEERGRQRQNGKRDR